MKRATTIVFIGAMALTAWLITARTTFTQAQATTNATPACGPISGNTTWLLANSPYNVCASGVSVPAGKTLTIEPGVTVQFEAAAGNTLTVQGTLIAIGTPTAPITLTGVVTTPGSWYGLSADGTVGSPAVLNLAYTTLAYGGVNGSYGAQVYADHAAVSIRHSLFRNGAGNGLYTTQNTHFDIQSTNFVGNGLNAIQLNSPATDLLMTGLSASGNGTNGVRVKGSPQMSGQRRWNNPGIPYIVDGNVGNQAGDIFTIDPGNELQFTSAGFLNIAGQLNAQGTSSEPITMTGQTKAPGAWRGLVVYGGNIQAVAQLDYVTIEYAGNDINGANIEVSNGRLIAHHSIIRYSSKDGVRFDSSAGGAIVESLVLNNTLYGIRNMQPTRAVLASNDWWGDPAGPQSDLTQCSSGHGNPVTAGVLFQPVLANTNPSGVFPLTNAPSLTLTPRRWFAPADGVTRVYFDITLRDGNGMPIPGRTVNLNSSLGTVTAGGITNVDGKTLAYLTSSYTGDAAITASLEPTSSCEEALSPETKVTFTQPINLTDLLPNAPASYFDGNLSVAPLPVLTGINTTISARLTNPLTTSVTVDVSFGFAQSGIGLVFGPIKDIVGQVIPGHSSVQLSASFVPVVAGHYCVQVSYDITGVGSLGASQPLATRQLKQFNLNVQQSTTSNPDKNNSLDKTRNSLKNVNRFVDRAYSPNPFGVPLAVANQGIAWDLNNAEKISNALMGDPPRQDYTMIDLAHVLSLPPVQPGNGISPARAAALNALNDALAQANAYGTAAAIAFDRYSGASAAGDLQWASTQSGVMLEYNQLMGTELITAALRIDNIISVAASEGVTSVVISTADVISMQQHLSTSGFSAQEIADAHTIGLTDTDIEVILQSILAANPVDLAGDIIPRMRDIRDQFLLEGRVLQNPNVFAPGLVVGSGGALPVQAIGNSMAQVYSMGTTIQLSNPFTQTVQVDLQARRIDLPADWSINVSPVQISLTPGQQVTVTVSVLAGSPVPQGSTPRVAVEGYVGTRLIGGVVFDLLVPNYMPFDGQIHLFLPLVEKNRN